MHPSLQREVVENALNTLKDIRVETAESQVPVEPLLPKSESLREITTTATVVETPSTPEGKRQMGLAEARAYLLKLQAQQTLTPIEKPLPKVSAVPKAPKRQRWQDKPEESETWLSKIQGKALKKFESRYSRDAAQRAIYDAA